MGADRDEIDRLGRVYEGYGRRDDRWNPKNPGNIRIESERRDALQELLAGVGLWPPRYRVLDVGCGAGAILNDFVDWGTKPANAVGIDVLMENARLAHRTHTRMSFACADARALPLPDRSVDLALAFTVFSSIMDESIAMSVASEIDRVLDHHGAVVWYDFRVSHPLNPHTRGIRRDEILRLFPNYSPNLRAITVVPQLVRRLGPFTDTIYSVLTRIPVMRTHYLGVLIKR